MSVSRFIDQTNIRKAATKEDIEKSAQECREYNFRGFCVNPEWTKTAKEELKETDVKIITLIDPPMGLSSPEERVAMAEKAKEDGSDEIDNQDAHPARNVSGRLALRGTRPIQAVLWKRPGVSA